MRNTAIAAFLYDRFVSGSRCVDTGRHSGSASEDVCSEGAIMIARAEEGD